MAPSLQPFLLDGAHGAPTPTLKGWRLLLAGAHGAPLQPSRVGGIPTHRLVLTICGLAELPNAREKCRTPMTVRTLQDAEIALPLYRCCLSVVLYLFQTKAAPDREAVEMEHDQCVQPIRNANYSSLLTKCFLYGR